MSRRILLWLIFLSLIGSWCFTAVRAVVPVPFVAAPNEPEVSFPVGLPPQVSPTPSDWPRDDELLIVRLVLSASPGPINEYDIVQVEHGIQQFILGHFPSVHKPPPVTLTVFRAQGGIAIFMVQVPTRIANSVRIALTDWVNSGALNRTAGVQVVLIDKQVPVYDPSSATPTPDALISGQKRARPVPTPAMPSPASAYLYLEATLYIQNLTMSQFTELYNEQLTRWMANSTNNILDSSQFYLTDLRPGSVYATYTAIVRSGADATNATQGLQEYVDSGAMTETAGVPISLVGGTVQTLGVAPATSLQSGDTSPGGAPPWVIAVATVLAVVGASLFVLSCVLWWTRYRKRQRRKDNDGKRSREIDEERGSGRSHSSGEIFMPEPVHMDEDMADDSDSADGTPTTRDAQRQQSESSMATKADRSPMLGTGEQHRPLSPPWAPVLVCDGKAPARQDQQTLQACRWQIDESELQILEHIGAGGFGSVHRALWRGTEVAVKRSLLDRPMSTEELQEFLAECEIMANLRHPCILQFFGAVVAPPNLCLVIELMPRGSLFDLLHTPADPSRRVRLPWRRRLAMMQDAARGMTYLHACNPPIIHRDLKSMNCLVSENWRVKISDFGLSRAKYRTFLTSRIAGGTPEWTAPEVIRNEPHNEKCDVYSFGVVAWEVITRRIPFAGLQPMQVLVAVAFQGLRLSMPLVPAGELHEDKRAYVHLLDRCLQERPQDRPSMAEVYQELVRIDREVRMRAEHASRPPRLSSNSSSGHLAALGNRSGCPSGGILSDSTRSTSSTPSRGLEAAARHRQSPVPSLTPLDMSKLAPLE
jgi:serine/threonine protein kinase